ncbi:BREX system ATP-binding domain-containing protein [Actinoplanes sp. NPDC048988]|uniref:helix-turn-helix transcriptional regulator n=1 Tax=Actinoplanes sp. NPDC048988 TaxID=3363901 RepID=UPI00372497EE
MGAVTTRPADRPGGRLIGREAECAALDGLLAEVTAGRSHVLVLRGEPGVGKSALLAHLADRAADWQVLSAAGTESERDMAYSGLHQLYKPLLAHLSRLPAPQADALGTVFGLRRGPAPDRFLVGLASLSLIARAADEGPVLCLVDDLQWLDPASAQILAFVARRWSTERVALVGAVRETSGEHPLEGLPEQTVPGLTDQHARTLLLAQIHEPFDEAVAGRIVAESRGNPLTLAELPRGWRPGALAGGFGLPAAWPSTDQAEPTLLRRLRCLPAGTRLLVLAAAAEPTGDSALLERAVERLGIGMPAIVAAVDAGVLRLNGRVEFAHPAVRSAVYRAARSADRGRVHRALAESIEAGPDGDRRAWHRAQAAIGPDEDVAAELERSAGRARARGGLGAGAAFLTRAAELTADPSARVRRALAAAAAGVEAAAFGAARAMLAVAADGAPGEPERARIDLIAAQLAFASSRSNQAPTMLLAAARRLQPFDEALARRAYLDALSAAHFAARLPAETGVVEVMRAARAAPAPEADRATAGDHLLGAFTARTDDYSAAVRLGRRALAELRREPEPSGDRLRWLWQGAVLALDLWDDESAYLLSGEHLRVARETGSLTELALGLDCRTWILVLRGDCAGASARAEEAASVHAAAGIDAAPAGALVLAAWRGDARPARALAEEARRAALARGEGLGVAVSDYCESVLGNSLGRYDQALPAARRACLDDREMVVCHQALPELIEAAVRCGRSDLAEEALPRLTARATASGTPWALGIEARCRALSSSGETAEHWYRQAVNRLSAAGVRADLARAHLLYGEWLRRTKHERAAQRELRAAYDIFTTAGMAGFAARAEHELVAAGGADRRAAESHHALTVQEAHIAGLVRKGLSNPEIGAQLFLSARTVEWHLRKVFTKLGVTSRRELRDLPDSSPLFATP